MTNILSINFFHGNYGILFGVLVSSVISDEVLFFYLFLQISVAKVSDAMLSRYLENTASICIVP